MSKTNWICSVKVVGGFLDGFQCDLSPHFNCVIGERGTGKSTLIELLRFALDLLPDKDEAPDLHRRIASLVKTNLESGRVEVVVETAEGLRYTIRRSWNEEPTIWSDDDKPVKASLKLSRLFTADIYSQDEIEEMADRTLSQLELVDRFEAQTIAQLNGKVEQILVELEENSRELAPVERKLAALKQELEELKVVEQKLATCSRQMAADSREADEALQKKAIRHREEHLAKESRQTLADLARDLVALEGKLEKQTQLLVDEEMTGGANHREVGLILEGLRECGRDVDRLLDEARRRIDKQTERLAEQAADLKHKHQEQNLAYQQLMEKHQQAQKQAAERSALDRRRNELKGRERTRDTQQRKLDQLRKQREEYFDRLSDLRDERFALRKKVVERINQSQSPLITVEIEQDGDRDRYREVLSSLLKSAKVQREVVARKLARSLWPTDLVRLIRNRDQKQLSRQGRINPEQAAKVIDVLAESDDLYELETAELRDCPTIRLKHGEYKELSSLSKGQKCTALLPIVLLDNNNPVLYDQPEDNIDSGHISELATQTIAQIKQGVQLVFVTHNANFPVLADAERVIVLASDGARADIKQSGTVNQCKQQILHLLDGGEEAFRKRSETYGTAKSR